VDKRANTALTKVIMWINTFQNHSEISIPYSQSKLPHRSNQLTDGDANYPAHKIAEFLLLWTCCAMEKE
jgi:hypothetical protein